MTTARAPNEDSPVMEESVSYVHRDEQERKKNTCPYLLDWLMTEKAHTDPPSTTSTNSLS